MSGGHSEEHAGYHSFLGLRRQELPKEMESCNNPGSVSILIVASPFFVFPPLLLHCRQGIFVMAVNSIAVQGIKADGFTPLHSELLK